VCGANTGKASTACIGIPWKIATQAGIRARAARCGNVKNWPNRNTIRPRIEMKIVPKAIPWRIGSTMKHLSSREICSLEVIARKLR